MSINDYRPTELASQRKKVSDNKNNTEDLTFAGSDIRSSHGDAARDVRKYNDLKEIERIILSSVDGSDYYDELSKD